MMMGMKRTLSLPVPKTATGMIYDLGEEKIKTKPLSEGKRSEELFKIFVSQ